MSIDWKKWFQRLAIVIGVIFFIGSIWQLWTMSMVDPVVASAATASMSIGVADKMAKYRLDEKYLANAEAFASGDFKQGATKKSTPRGIAQRQIASVPHGEMNGSIYSSTINSVKRNTFFLSIVNNDATFSVGRCLGICGRYALISDHFYEAWQNFSKMYSTSVMHYIPSSAREPTCITLNFNQLRYVKYENSALGLLELPNFIPAFKDIRKFICPKRFHAYNNGLGTIIEMDGTNKHQITLRESQVNFNLQQAMRCKGGELYSDFDTGICYSYQGFHGAGRCGSILLAPSLNTMIMGMHIAGNSTTGFAESIYAEMFDDLNNCPSSEPSIGEGMDSSWYIDGEVIGIGAVTSKFAHRANAKSRIIPSEVQNAGDDKFPVFTAVSVLDKKDPRIAEEPFSPMVEGCKHHGKPLIPFNKLDLIMAGQDLENLILSKCKPQRAGVGVLSRMQVINGIDELPNYDSLEWNSSEGFPFVANRKGGAKDKRWLFEFNDENKVTKISDLLTNTLDRKWTLRNNNIIPETVFTDCLKDCTVSKDKVLIPGKTRIFSISPVDFTIQQRQCTLDFTVAYMANRLKLEHAIGINPDSMEWGDLARALIVVGDDVLTGDYSKFGDTIPPAFIHIIFDIIISWYRANKSMDYEHEQQLKIMAHEIGNSTHLMFNFLYKVVCGQPSGNSLTVIINSLANSLYIRLAWLHIMRDTKYNSLVDLHKHVKWFSYGDDLIAALSSEIKDIFNAGTLAKFFSSHNLKFTNADKGDSIIPYTKLNKADFLKRGFSLHPMRLVPQVFLAPLGDASIEDTVNWVNKDSFGRDNPNCQNFRDMSIQVCEDALRNAFGKGPKYYESFRLKLQHFWRERGVNFVCAAWYQLDYKIFNLNEPLHPYFKFKYIAA